MQMLVAVVWGAGGGRCVSTSVWKMYIVKQLFGISLQFVIFV